MLSKSDLASWEHQKGIWGLLLFFNIWLLAEKIHVSDQQGSFRYSSRSPSWDIHGMKLKSTLWSTLVPLHNAKWLPKFLQMCLNIIIKILVRLSYCYFNPDLPDITSHRTGCSEHQDFLTASLWAGMIERAIRKMCSSTPHLTNNFKN